MANEGVCIETPTIFERRVIADGSTVAFGTIMKLTDNNTVIASSADNDPFGGILWVVKDANDGIVEAVVAMDGIWGLKDSGSGGNAGAMVNIGGTNLVVDSAAADLLTGSILGKRLMNASSSEVTRIKVGHNV